MCIPRNTRLLLACLAVLIGVLLFSIRAPVTRPLDLGERLSIKPHDSGELVARASRSETVAEDLGTRKSMTLLDPGSKSEAPPPAGVFVLHIRDEHSGKDLSGIEVAYEAEPDPRRVQRPLEFAFVQQNVSYRTSKPARGKHPGLGARLTTLIENGTSPIHWEPSGKRGLLWIRTAGHAWTAIPVLDAREHWIYLRRSCSVDLRIDGLDLAQPVYARVVSGHDFTDSGSTVLEFLVEDQTTRLDGLPFGELQFMAHGSTEDGTQLRSEIWSGRFAPGERRPAWIELAPPLRSRFAIHCAAQATQERPRSVELLDLRSGVKSIAKWTLDELEFFDDEDERHWLTPELSLTEGSYTAVLLPLHQLVEVDVEWQRPLQTIDIEASPSIETRVRCIDRNTGDPIHDVKLLYQQLENRSLDRRPELWKELDLLGPTLRLPEGPCVIRTDDPHYVGLEHKFRIRDGEDEVVVELARAAFLQLDLLTARGPLSPAWDQLEPLFIDEAASGSGELRLSFLFRTAEGTVSLHLRADAEGLCRLHLDPLPDLVPRSTDLDLILRRGQLTTHELHFDPR